MQRHLDDAFCRMDTCKLCKCVVEQISKAIKWSRHNFPKWAGIFAETDILFTYPFWQRSKFNWGKGK